VEKHIRRCFGDEYGALRALLRLRGFEAGSLVRQLARIKARRNSWHAAFACLGNIPEIRTAYDAEMGKDGIWTYHSGNAVAIIRSSATADDATMASTTIVRCRRRIAADCSDSARSTPYEQARCPRKYPLSNISAPCCTKSLRLAPSAILASIKAMPGPMMTRRGPAKAGPFMINEPLAKREDPG
jgi:hypothetical protein